MCKAVVVIVVVATFFTVSVLFYSVVFAFSLLLLLLLYVLLFYLARGNTTRCQINKPALAWRPQKPLPATTTTTWELGITATKHTHALPSRELRVVSVCVCVFCNLCCCCRFCYCCCLISHFFRHSHTHRHNSHIDTRLFANQLARCKICYSIFEKTLLLCAYAKWLATTTINNHFFPYSKIYFKWEYQQQKTHTR